MRVRSSITAALLVMGLISAGLKAHAQSVQSPSAAGMDTGDFISFGYSRIQSNTVMPLAANTPSVAVPQTITDAYGPFLSLGNQGWSLDLGFVASHLRVDMEGATATSAYGILFGFGYADEIMLVPVETLPEPIRVRLFARPLATAWKRASPGFLIMAGGEAGLSADIKIPLPPRFSMLSITMQPRIGMGTPHWFLYDSNDDTLEGHPAYSSWLTKLGFAVVLNWRRDNPTPAILGADWLLGSDESTRGFVLTMGIGL